MKSKYFPDCYFMEARVTKKCIICLAEYSRRQPRSLRWGWDGKLVMGRKLGLGRIGGFQPHPRTKVVSPMVSHGGGRVLIFSQPKLVSWSIEYSLIEDVRWVGREETVLYAIWLWRTAKPVWSGNELPLTKLAPVHSYFTELLGAVMKSMLLSFWYWFVEILAVTPPWIVQA